MPSIAKIKDYLSSTKQRITSIKSIADLKTTIAVAYEHVKQKVSSIQQKGFKSILEPLKKRLNKILNRREEK